MDGNSGGICAVLLRHFLLDFRKSKQQMDLRFCLSLHKNLMVGKHWFRYLDVCFRKWRTNEPFPVVECLHSPLKTQLFGIFIAHLDNLGLLGVSKTIAFFISNRSVCCRLLFPFLLLFIGFLICRSLRESRLLLSKLSQKTFSKNSKHF